MTVEMMFKLELESIVHQPCCMVSCTAGVGSMVIIHFGPKIHQVTELPTRTIVREAGKFAILMEFAAWRCRSGSHLLCSSSSPNGVDSSMEIGLNELIDKEVLAVEIEEETADLQIKFSGGMFFEILCDQVDIDVAHDNYNFRSPRGYYVVGPGAKVSFSPRAE